MSESLKSLSGNEQPWANHSGRSRQMSNCEQFSQVAHDKWANERFAQKIWLNKSKILFFSMFYIRFFLFTMWVKCSRCSPKMSDVSESLRTLTKNERPSAIRSGRSEEMSNHERIAQVFHETWAIRSGRSEKMSDHERFAQVTQHKRANERIVQKIPINS